MDKQTIVNKVDCLVDAADKAREWIGRNEEMVRSCGKSPADIQANLRKETRLLKRLGRAAQRQMCAGVFGPSQAGKSYLLSSLARDSDKKVIAKFKQNQYDFLRDLNPGGNKESTGLVTRFTMKEPEDIPDDFPVHVRLLSETELVKIFANSYFCDCEHRTEVTIEEVDRKIKQTLDTLKEKATNTPAQHITLDALEDLKEYMQLFNKMSRHNSLERLYWKEAMELAPRLAIEDRATLFGIIWDNIEEFDSMFLRLARDLEKLGNAEEAFCSMDAMIPREASIIDVDTLGTTDFSQYGISGDIKMRSRDGHTASISRQNATAIIAELTLVMINKPAEYFEHTDLLDFPGYKARLECADIRQYMAKKDKADSAVEQFFRRGKVAYLFQRYNMDRELNSLLLCVAEPSNTPGLPAAVEDWIIGTHGKTPQDRANARTALLYILTKSDRHFEDKSGAKMETRWNDVVHGVFMDQFSGTHSSDTQWVENWKPGQPFNNLYMLRNVNIKWDSMMDNEEHGESWTEIGVNPKKETYRDDLRKAFIESSLVKKHFRAPAEAFDEVMKINDGGIENIKRSLQPVCDPNLKLGQIDQQVDLVLQRILSIISSFYKSDDAEEEKKKKLNFLSNFTKLFKNPNFIARFPELLSNFKITPDELYYLYSDAERKYDAYKSEVYAKLQESVREGLEKEDKNVTEDNVLDDLFNDLSPSAPAVSESENDSRDVDKTDLDIHYFYAGNIIDAWSDKMRNFASSVEHQNYYQFTEPLFRTLLDEFDLAVVRLSLQAQMEKKFREIYEPVDVPKESKIRKQAAYAIGLLNDFTSWMGKTPSKTPESLRKIKYNNQDVAVFKNKPEIEDFPHLSETFTPFANQWHKDWLTCFYGVLMDNAANKNITDSAENSRLGKIIKQINGIQANS